MVKPEPHEGSRPGPSSSGGQDAAAPAVEADWSDEEVVDDEDEREDDDDGDGEQDDDGEEDVAGHGGVHGGQGAPQPQAEAADEDAAEHGDGEADGASGGDAVLHDSGGGGGTAAQRRLDAAATASGGSRGRRRRGHGSVRTAADGPLVHRCFYCNMPAPAGELTRCCSCTPVSLELNCSKRCHLRCAALLPGQLLQGFEELHVWFCGGGRSSRPQHTPENYLKVVNASNPEADAVRAYVHTRALLHDPASGAMAAAAQAAGGGAQGPGSALPAAWFAPERVRARGRGLVPDPQQPGRVTYAAMLLPNPAAAAAAAGAGAGAAAGADAGAAAAAGGLPDATTAASPAGGTKRGSKRSGSERIAPPAEPRDSSQAQQGKRHDLADADDGEHLPSPSTKRGRSSTGAATGTVGPEATEEERQGAHGTAAAHEVATKPDPDQQHEPLQRGGGAEGAAGLRRRSGAAAARAQHWQPVPQMPPQRAGDSTGSGSAGALAAAAAVPAAGAGAATATRADASATQRRFLQVGGPIPAAVCARAGSSGSDDSATGRLARGMPASCPATSDAPLGAGARAGEHHLSAERRAAAGAGTGGPGVAAEVAAAEVAALRAQLEATQRELAEERTGRIRAEARAEFLEEQRRRHEQELREERDKAVEARVTERMLRRQLAELENQAQG
ncbi:hypothetical protein HXX76_005939 [Chlamydomonas incerta]|uniref:Uncharacterized protein n=1 Tax=Chlamydomonas incerta TaxID=51695 RepID=A0A835TEF2_CHLIN|nr:hypothetical protein HXX76_005939 [Chlamydomonas incerta]|eukprot:KAG2437280.1 hypothetical protein HXX76_005939 [Chlamydomonas incerta]